ncbi:hypothetical protein BGZ96_008439 [Linnemannia gamsii]|uniref:F-box domain-containing protein n=1 Tax=Linnemannia gamsii TaxID=64522 RepID=A0ABQ7JZC3_9FUNG|nr:hypothetical protein BGZ96_008439 [Linnemannia gamsii]
MTSSFTPPLSSSSSSSSSSASSIHSLYDIEYDDRMGSDPHAAKVAYNYHFNPDTVTYEAYISHGDFDDDYDYEPQDDYDDYDDIRLVPPSPHRLKSKRNNKPLEPKVQKKQLVATKVIQPMLESPQPPELPLEILELVCTHLSQTALRYGVNQVCKKWHEVSNRFIRRAGIWKPVKGTQELLLEQWPKINTLELWFGQDPESPTISIASYTNLLFWSAFAAAITASTSTEQEARQEVTKDNSNNNSENDRKSDLAIPLSLLQTIRHLELRGSSVYSLDIAPKLRGHLQFVESFTITTVYYNANIPLFTILADFPSLRTLTAPLQYTTQARLTHGDSDDNIVDVPEPEIDPETAHFPRKPWVIPPPKMFPERYRLQTFSVTGVSTNLHILERLLVTCPDLRVFKANNTYVNMFIRQRSEDAEHNARQRLIDLAAKHCPRLEWYNFHRLEYSATDGIHLGHISRTFPNHKFLSMTLGVNQEMILDNLVAKDLLSRITVLDIQPSPYVNVPSEAVDRILCLTPNLLHLHCLKANLCTGSLWKPPAPVQPTPIPFFTHVRDRKRYERNERRKARQQALARFQPPSTITTNERETDATNTPTINPLTPDTWQLYSLKTLEMSLSTRSTMVAFTNYISQHRLFRNLVTFNLQIPSLKVGQRMTFADPKKPTAVATSHAGTTPVTAASNAPGGCKQYSSVTAPPPEPERFPNELLALRGLRCLEECALRPKDIPGMILAKDFEFLRRKGDFQTMSFIPKRRKSSAKSSTLVDPASTDNFSSARKSKGGSSQVKGDSENDGTDDDDEDGDEDDEGEEKWERMKTFWPKLNTFHVYYISISPFISTSKLTYGVEQIRPGVAVCFQHRAILS